MVVRTYSATFNKILDAIAEDRNYAFGDFLAEFFGSPPDRNHATGRSQRHGQMLGMFIEGRTTVGVGEVLQALHCTAEEFSRHQGPLWTLAHPYGTLKAGYAALTSYAAQNVRTRLLEEQNAAVDPHAGLHVFEPRKPGEEDLKLRLSWDTFGGRTLADIQAILVWHQPLTFQYLYLLAYPERHDAEKDVFRYRPPHVTATETLCQINYARNRNAKRLQLFNGILYYSSGASHTILDHTSRTGITTSYNDIRKTLEQLSKDEAKRLKVVGRDPNRGLDLVFDNVQTYAKQWEMRIGRENVMKVGMAATAVEIDGFNPGAVNLERRRQLIRKGMEKIKTLTAEDVLGLLNEDHARTVGALHWLQILITYVPQLETYKGGLQEMFRTKPSASMRLDQNGVHRTILHPLATSGKNETTIKELKDGLVDFLEQMGQTPDDYQQRIILTGGDGLTFEQMGNLKRYMQTQDGPFKTFEILQPYLQLWHTEWTDMCRLFVAHFGDERSVDPSTIRHSSAKIGFKRPANLAKIDYYPGSHHLYRVLDARVLDCWRLRFKTENLWTYFDNLDRRHEIPSPEDLFNTAVDLWNNYSNPNASTAFIAGHQLSDSVVPIGELWRKEEDTTESEPAPSQAAGGSAGNTREQEWENGRGGETNGKDAMSTGDKEFQGDRTLARSASFMYEALVSKEVAQAVAEGDVGRVYEGVKMMLVTFAGSSHIKYTGYLLDTISFLEFSAGQELRTMFLWNWLVNPSGEPGRYIEKDLMQEHHNEVLEERQKKQGSSWDSRQMRDIHARTVQHIERIKKELRTALALSPKGWKHPKPHDRPEIKILLDVYRATQLHTFRRGRQYQSSANFVDSFSQGAERLEVKLDKWKDELEHSGLTATTHLRTPKISDPEDGLGDGGEVGDGEESGEGDPTASVAQTEGHCEFVDGELHMVDDEAQQKGDGERADG